MQHRLPGVVALLWLLPDAGAQQLAFIDEAPALGLTGEGFGRGAAWIDLDGDGLYDIVETSAGQPTRFWRRRPEGGYENANELWNVPVFTAQTWGVLAADFDGDGDPDLAFPNGGFGSSQPNRLLLNDLAVSGAFLDVTDSAGDFPGLAGTFGGAVLDYDRDGDLDVFFSNVRFPAGPARCTLLRNDLEQGLGLRFTDVSTAAGIVNEGAFLHCTAGDFDNDGWIDIGVGSLVGSNLLYRNCGDGTFTDVAAQLGVDSPLDNFGFVFEDFDNDGWLDIYLPKYQLDPVAPSRLYRNDGAGGFIDVTDGSGLGGQTDMGHNTADLDGDGYPDIYIGTGGPSAAFDDVLCLITPTADGRFSATDVSAASGILAQGPTRLHGIVFADDDGDGDLDVFANNGGPSNLPATAQRNFFWRNQGTGAHWLAVELEGRVSNRDAIGARVAVLCPDGRRVFRRRSVGRGFANTDPPTLHFGLASDDTAVQLEIDWPSGLRQVVPLGDVDRSLAVEETGLLLVDAPQPGAAFTVLIVGAPGAQVVLAVEVSLPGAPAGAGARSAVGYHLPVGGLTLGPTGKKPFAFQVPVGPAAQGASWTIGALFSDPAGGPPFAAQPLVVSLR